MPATIQSPTTKKAIRISADLAYVDVLGSVETVLDARTSDTQYALTGTQDLVRIPVLQSPIIDATGVNYNGNRATFTVIGNASVGLINALPFSAAGLSKVTNIAIVAAPTGVYTGDVLYAHTSLAAPLPVIATGQVGATYAVEIY